MSAKPPTVTEAEFQAQIIEVAHLFGFTVASFRAARTKHGWRTPVGADAEGFPDLQIYKMERKIAIEAKSEKGKTTERQEFWLLILKLAGFETYVLRPSQYDEMVEILRGEARVK